MWKGGSSVTKRAWIYVCSAALLAEVTGSWLMSNVHASDVPFAVTYRTQAEYITDRLIVWGLCFVPLMAVAAFLLRGKSK